MSHVSFSSLKIWNECPFKHKLLYIDRLKGFTGNEFTAFGTAIHDVCEQSLIKEDLNPSSYFLESFAREVKQLEKYDESLVLKMKDQGLEIIPFVKPALDDYFKNYEVVSTEENLLELIDDFEEAEYDFKGFIDLVVKTSDGKYHIIDWKTCSWGWDARRRSDKMVTYQLTLYKYYFSKKHNIDLDKIETHFALLKRTSKKDRVEIFRVTSGKIKMKNALNFMQKALYNINAGKHIKNRLSCNRCEFYKTVNCP